MAPIYFDFYLAGFASNPDKELEEERKRLYANGMFRTYKDDIRDICGNHPNVTERQEAQSKLEAMQYVLDNAYTFPNDEY